MGKVVYKITENGTYSFDENSNIKNIIVDQGVKADITVKNINVVVPEDVYNWENPAITIGENSEVTINIKGDNKLTVGGGGAGIYVALGATLKIEGDGKLEINRECGAAIGSNDDYNKKFPRGTIIINSGDIIAVSQYGAGIGGQESWNKKVETASRIGSQTYYTSGKTVING